MKNLLKKEWLLLFAVAAPFLYLALVWPRIPERVPIHFNANFVIDGRMEKSVGAWLLPVSSIVTILVVRLWFFCDPKMAKCSPETREQVERVIRQCLLALAIFMSSLSVAIIWAAWGQMAPVEQVTLYGLPLVLIVVGNGMGKLRPNHTIGIRVPWTLNSPSVWNRTHRLAGVILVGVGLVLIGLAAAGLPEPLYFYVLLSLLAAWSLTAIVYSYLQSRAESGPGASENSAVS